MLGWWMGSQVKSSWLVGSQLMGGQLARSQLVGSQLVESQQVEIQLYNKLFLLNWTWGMFHGMLFYGLQGYCFSQWWFHSNDRDNFHFLKLQQGASMGTNCWMVGRLVVGKFPMMWLVDTVHAGYIAGLSLVRICWVTPNLYSGSGDVARCTEGSWVHVYTNWYRGLNTVYSRITVPSTVCAPKVTIKTP